MAIVKGLLGILMGILSAAFFIGVAVGIWLRELVSGD